MTTISTSPASVAGDRTDHLGGNSRRAAVGRWLAPLFPSRPAGVNAWSRRMDVLVPALLVLVSPAVMLARVGGLPAVNTIYAEDGEVFLTRAYQGHPWSSLTDPYAGYLQLWPRSLAAVGTLFTVDSAASYLAWASALTAGICAAFVYVAAAGHVPLRGVRVVLALSVLFLPAAVAESVDVVAYLQWFLLPAIFWALLWSPRGKTGLVAGSVLIAVGVASAPLALLLAPLVIARLIAVRNTSGRVFPIAFAVGALGQVITILRTTRPPTPDHPSLDSLARSYGVRVVLGSLDGLKGSVGHFRHLGWWSVLGAAAVLLVAVILAWGQAESRRFAVVAIIGSVLFFVFGAGYAWNAVMRPTRTQIAPYIASRYSMMPIMFLLALLAVGLSQRPTWIPRGLVAVFSVLVLAQLSRAAVADFSATTARGGGPTWSAALATTRATCATESPNTALQIPITPAQWWVGGLDCADLRK